MDGPIVACRATADVDASLCWRSALVFDALGAGDCLRDSGSGDGRLALARSLLGAVDAMTCSLAWLCSRLLYDDEVLCRCWVSTFSAGPCAKWYAPNAE